MVNLVLTWAIVAVWVGGCLFALLKGEWPERSVGTFLIVSFFASRIIGASAVGTNKQVADIAVEITLTCLLFLVAWNSRRSWPVWAVAFQVIGLALKVSLFFDMRVGHFAAVSANNLSAYGLIVTLIIGTWIVWRERAALMPIDKIGAAF